VHQDGLVHVSAMSKNFVSDPRSVVKSGDVVRVKVLSVDVPRHRISLTLRLDDEAPAPADDRGRPQGRSAENLGRTGRGSRPRPAPSAPQGALADALRKAGLVPKTPKTPKVPKAPSNPEPRRRR